MKVSELIQQFNAKEDALNRKDFKKDKEEIIAIAREQVALLAQAGSLEREAAQKAEQMSKSKLNDSAREFFGVVAQIEKKRAEIFDTLRECAEAWMNEGEFNSIVMKRNALNARVEALQKEVKDLEEKSAALQGSMKCHSPCTTRC